MAITEAEAGEQLDRLTQEIRSRKDVAGWDKVIQVLDLIDSEIAEGRPFLRKVRVEESGGRDQITGQVRKGPATSADLMGSVPYSRIEALDLTAEALALAFISPVKMASKLLGTLDRFSNKGQETRAVLTVHISGRGGPDAEEGITFDAERVAQARQSLQPLADGLAKLIRELGLQDRQIAFETGG
jgi:hypothetical protein